MGSYPKTKEEWKKVCVENGIQSLDDYIAKREEINLPERPQELYRHFIDILHELDLNQKKIRRLNINL